MKSINPLLISGARHEFRNTIIYKDAVVFGCFGVMIFLSILFYRQTPLAFFWSYAISFFVVLFLLKFIVYILSFFLGNTRYWQNMYMNHMMQLWGLRKE